MVSARACNSVITEVPDGAGGVAGGASPPAALSARGGAAVLFDSETAALPLFASEVGALDDWSGMVSIVFTKVDCYFSQSLVWRCLGHHG